MKKIVTMLSVIAVLIGCGTPSRPVSQEELLTLAKGHDLVAVFPDGRVETYNGRGLGPLLTHLEKGDLKGKCMIK